MMKLDRSLPSRGAVLAAVLALTSCAQEPKLVASNCAKNCTKTAQPLRKIDKADILLVVDDSDSMTNKRATLKQQLPRLLNAIATGQAEDMKFPPADSIHVAVVNTDMGTHAEGVVNCQGAGQDGLFLTPGDEGVTCDVEYPGYLAFEAGPAAIATVDSVSCLPVRVFAEGQDSYGGCGFEQPLEAGLKALWPASNPAVKFKFGAPHGESENAGFLRQDSLLVVVVVTDEDDCSTDDTEIFTAPQDLDPQSPLLQQSMNLRCVLNPTRLNATSRYVDGLRALRPHNDAVIFAAIAGVPADLVSGGDQPDLDAVLADSRMQNVVDDRDSPDVSDDTLKPSCTGADGSPSFPPRRLVEVAQGFGADGVVGSLCDEDFGASTGSIIRAIGARLIEYSQGKN